MMLSKRKVHKGFTMIELLIVMMIIGVLAGLSLFSMQGARKQGRDGKRKADLETIRSALELVKADCNTYPATIPTATNALTVTCGGVTNTYIKEMPGDPNGGNYIYDQLTTVTYELCATLEDPPASPPSCSGSGNYKVTNP